MGNETNGYGIGIGPSSCDALGCGLDGYICERCKRRERELGLITGPPKKPDGLDALIKYIYSPEGDQAMREALALVDADIDTQLGTTDTLYKIRDELRGDVFDTIRQEVAQYERTGNLLRSSEDWVLADRIKQSILALQHLEDKLRARWQR